MVNDLPFFCHKNCKACEISKLESTQLERKLKKQHIYNKNDYGYIRYVINEQI